MTLGRLRDYDILILVSLIWFLGKFVRYAFPPLFEPLQGAYDVSNATIGTAYTGLLVVYALMQFPSGVVADRFGAARVIVVGVLVSGAGAAALVFDASFVVLVAAMLVIGAGTGLHKTVAVRLIARIYTTRTGRALGAHDTFGAFSGVAAPTVVVVFLSAPPMLDWLLGRLPGAAWRGVFLITAVAAVTLGVAFAVRLRGRLPGPGVGPDSEPAAPTGPLDQSEPDGSSTETPDSDSTSTERPGTDTPSASEYLDLFRDWRFTGFVLVTIGVSFAHNGLVAFLPLYLSQVSGLPTTTASLLFSLFFWVTFVQLVTGDLSDRVGRYPVLFVTAGIAAVAMWGLVVAPDLRVLALGALIAAVGVGAHGFQPVRSAYLMELLPERIAGGGLGVVRTLLMGIGALAPGIVGVVADVASFQLAFGLLAGAMALAAIGAALLWRVDRTVA